MESPNFVFSLAMVTFAAVALAAGWSYMRTRKAQDNDEQSKLG